MSENAEKTAKKQRIIGKPFKKGQSGNPNGRPEGVKNFKTIFEEAVKKIAKEKQIDPNSIEADLVVRAIAGARSGDYRYYKDIFDRIYGAPKQSTDITTGGKPLSIQISKEASKKYDIDPSPISDTSGQSQV